MVRSYIKKTERAEINEDDVSKAIKAALEGNLSIRKAALMFNIKPATLQHRLEKMKARNGEERVRNHGSKYSSQQVFTAKQEKQLNEYIVKCNELHHGLTLKQMRCLAYEFAKKLRCKYPESWNGNEMAGKDWMYGFRSRNANLSLRKPEKTSIMRCVGFRREAVEEFFNNYESVMKRYNFARDRIFNFDETGITTVLDTPKVLASKHQRQVGQVVSAERSELVTFGAFISATGNQYPPVFIFPRVHYKDHCIAGAPEGSLGLAFRSGWMTADLFLIVLRYIKQHTNSSIENRILLLCDNHQSHVSIEAIDYCRANGIVYLSFPPHTSHKLQPLDVAVFGPFKAKLKIAFNDWHLNNPGKHLSIYNIPKLAKLANLESFTPKNIVSGFEKTGIVPFNRLVFSDSDFSPSTISIPHSHSDTVVVTPPQTDSATPSTVSRSQGSNVPQSSDSTQTPRPSNCSNKPVTPEDVRSYPTASGSRTNKRKGRQPGKSRIYTDSPEKKRLFDMKNVKEEKQAAAQQRNRDKELKNAKILLGIEYTKPLKRQTKRKKVEELYSSDESSETSLGQLCDSTSDDFNLSDLLGEEADTLEDDTMNEADTSGQNIVDDDFVIVRFAKKRSVVHFVGQVKGKTYDGDHLVRFMNRKPGNFFIFPEKEDNGGVEVPDMTKLPQPTSGQGTARTSDVPDYDFEDGPDECPRDRTEAIAHGRNCLRKCKNDQDCISTRKRCLCDGLCGWSCIRPDLHCKDLLPPDYGVLKVTGEGFGSKATYSCESGYWLSGTRERVCQGDSTWSGNKPECKIKESTMCGSPPPVPHTRNSAPLDKEDFPLDSVVQYNCFPGYDPKGFNRAMCLQYNGSAQWFGPDLTCIPRSCSPLGDIEHGRREGDSFTFTSRVTYHCDIGFELVGRPSRYCQSNGQWSAALPSCKPVQCSIPENPPNGRGFYTSVSFNSVVKYECRFGFKLVGPSTRTCNTNKEWEGEEPYCEEIKCEDPGPFYNGYFEGRSYILGSTVIFHCFDGMKMEGSSATTCKRDGTWSNPIPKCLSPCIVPEIDQGNFTDYPVGARVPHGLEINITCEAKFDVGYNVTPVTCNNGTWTHVPSCVPARCRQLPDKPKHGIVIAPKTDHGMKARFMCKDGYKLVGPNVTECHYGEWTVPSSVCKEIYCPFPGVLEHGRVMLVGYMGMYDYRPYVKKVTNNRQIMYECKRHYTLVHGPPGATCVDGQWSPKEMPRCVRGQHPVLTTGQQRRRRRELLRRHRRGGRRRRREKQMKNKERLIKESCSLKQTDWMEVEIIKMGRGNESLPHGTIINVTCIAGHRLNIGNRTAKCVRGRWKPKEPECLTLPCSVPNTANGVYHHFEGTVAPQEGVAHGEVLTLTCLPGFQLMGPDSLRCWYGDWAVDNLPECLPSPCELPVIPQGHYLGGYRSGLTISHGSTVDYDCKPDYVRATDEPILCSEGTLKPQPPACLHHTKKSSIVSYPDIQETDIRYRQTVGSDDNVAVDMPLTAGYRPCGPPERQQNTLLYPTNKGNPYFLSDSEDDEEEEDEDDNHGPVKWFAHNTEIRFNCIKGIYGEKTTWKIVCQDGNWVGGAYKCEAEPDPPPDEDRRNKSCIFYNTEPNLVAFLGDKMIDEEETEHPPHTELVFRCKDIGKYSLIGSVRRRCTHGDWDGVKPTCYGLSQENDYALEKPPTILFRHQLGPIAQSNEGKLIVYPGTILHLECLWIRKYGIPHWQVSHSYRKYPEGWTNEAGRDPQLEYRLSIYHAQKDDSGRFTCITPMGHRHSVDIVVAAVHCPQIPSSPGLHVSNPSTKMNTKVVFSCRDGQTLIGADEATCMPSGNWSEEAPACRVTECPDLSNSTSDYLRADVSGRTVGSQATFSCPTGYGLRGDDTLECLDTGQWSTDVPFCEEVICESPEVPKNGYLQSSNKDVYRGGDILQFACNTNYMMDGKAIIVCQESGRWSAPVPKCVSACQYPGTTPGATISNVQFFYRINETVTFDCADGFELRGAKMLRCLDDGRWSSTTPTCHATRKG